MTPRGRRGDGRPIASPIGGTGTGAGPAVPAPAGRAAAGAREGPEGPRVPLAAAALRPALSPTPPPPPVKAAKIRTRNAGSDRNGSNRPAGSRGSGPAREGHGSGCGLPLRHWGREAAGTSCGAGRAPAGDESVPRNETEQQLLKTPLLGAWTREEGAAAEDGSRERGWPGPLAAAG